MFLHRLCRHHGVSFITILPTYRFSSCIINDRYSTTITVSAYYNYFSSLRKYAYTSIVCFDVAVTVVVVVVVSGVRPIVVFLNEKKYDLELLLLDLLLSTSSSYNY